MISIVAALVLTAASAPARPADADEAPLPADLRQRFEQLAAPDSNVDRLVEVLVQEIAKLPPDQRQRAEELLDASLHARFASRRYPKVFARIGPLWGFPDAILGTLEELLEDERPVGWSTFDQFILKDLLDDVEQLSPARKRTLRDHLSRSVARLHPSPRMKLTVALARMGDPGALAPVAWDLRSSGDRRRRYDAAVVLALSKHEKAVVPLRSAARDQVPEVRCVVLHALAELDPPWAVAEARRHLDDFEVATYPGEHVPEDWPKETVADCALFALGKAGDVEVVRPLLKALADPRVKGAACGGLLTLRDRLGGTPPHDCDPDRWAEWLAARSTP